MEIGNQKTKDDGYVNVSTKVPPHVAEFLNIFAKSKGTDIYGLLQMFIQTIIRAAKCTTALDPQTKLLMEMLEMDTDWNRAFNFASTTAMADVAQVILVVQQYDGKGANRKPRKGYGLVMIEKSAMPNKKPHCTYCVDDILERVVEVSMQGLYKELRQCQVNMKSKSVRETLMTLCDAALIEHLNEIDREELPGLGDYHDFGKVIEWGNRAKQKKHRSPDSIANQQTIIFDDFDRETAQPEIENWEGEHKGNIDDGLTGGVRPFDVEP